MVAPPSSPSLPTISSIEALIMRRCYRTSPLDGNAPASEYTCTTYTTCTALQKQRSSSSVSSQGPRQNANNLVLLMLATVCLCRSCIQPYKLPRPPTRPIRCRDYASAGGSG